MLITLIPTITAGLYTANDCVGGKLNLTGTDRITGLSFARVSLLQSFTIIDLAMQNAAMSIYLFGSDPVTGVYTNDSELDIDDTDAALCIGCFNVLTGDYLSVKDNSVACVSNLGILCRNMTWETLYALMKTTGTPTYASTSDLKLVFGFRQD
jgi:hypothetical protein